MATNNHWNMKPAFVAGWKEWEYWPKPITPQLPPVGNKPSMV